MTKISVLTCEKSNCGVLVPFCASFGASPPDVREESGRALWMFSASFWPEQGLGNSARWFIWKFGQTDWHVCLRKHTISIYFCLEGLGFRVLGFRV